MAPLCGRVGGGAPPGQLLAEVVAVVHPPEEALVVSTESLIICAVSSDRLTGTGLHFLLVEPFIHSGRKRFQSSAKVIALLHSDDLIT
jgi:hypothetical protein